MEKLPLKASRGKEACSRIYLPVVNDKALKAAEEKSCAEGSGSILLVDDEEATLKMMRLMITQLGFNITALKSPQQALELFRQHPEAFDLVMTDLTMSQMTGVEFAEKIHEIQPKLPIILMTGYTKNEHDTIPLDQFGIRKYLKKPLKMKEIASVINELIIPASEN